jgi:hypothetical protein
MIFYASGFGSKNDERTSSIEGNNMVSNSNVRYTITDGFDLRDGLS